MKKEDEAHREKLFGQAIENTLKTCLGLKEGESVIILTDSKMGNLGGDFFKKTIELGGEAMIMDIPPGSVDGEEPPVQVARAMQRVNLVLMLTSVSYTHTSARENAANAGVRIASMPRITKDSIIRTLNADYNEIRNKCRGMINVLKDKKVLKVTTEKGTDLNFKILGREFFGGDGGIFDKQGVWGNLPAGEVFFAPFEKQTKGTVVVDASIAGFGKLSEDVTIKVNNGYVFDISGGKVAENLGAKLRTLGRDAHNLAEFGIGLNDKAKISGIVLEDEKMLGTAHIALGNNVFFGGTVRAPCHIDCVFKKPSIWADELQIMDTGKLLLDI